MIKKLLIANRGEIALRIIRAAKELGIKTVAVYSEADRASLHVRFADEAVCVGPAQGKLSYLNIPSLIAAADVTNADAIHPGYGFLAENATFAEICLDCNLTVVGPSPDAITRMGNKSFAKDTMIAAGVPVVPGSDGIVPTVEDARRVAEEVGYPVMIKAVAGGGGKGMRYVEIPSELDRAYAAARNEAEASFGNGDIYIEKFVEEPRHIEIQVFGDTHGNIVHLNERECSIQRRHQKLIEETPSPIMTPELRSMYDPLDVSTRMRSPSFTNRGTFTLAPVSTVAGLSAFVAVSPRTPGSVDTTRRITWLGIATDTTLSASSRAI